MYLVPIYDFQGFKYSTYKFGGYINPLSEFAVKVPNRNGQTEKKKKIKVC